MNSELYISKNFWNNIVQTYANLCPNLFVLIK